MNVELFVYDKFDKSALDILTLLENNSIKFSVQVFTEEDSLDYILCPTNPGDVVLFDSYCPHRSKPNNTSKPRRVLYITYNKLSDGDHRSKYYADKRLHYPQDCERDPNKKYEFLV